MGQVIRFYCDFCGEEILKYVDRRMVSGAIEHLPGGYEARQAILEINELLLCQDCHEDLVSEASHLTDYINSHDKRNNDAEIKEAAYRGAPGGGDIDGEI